MTLKPSRSRWLVVWWGSLHALAAAGLLWSAVPWWLAAPGLAALAAHLWLAAPAPPTPVERGADGLWSLPAEGRAGLRLREGASVGPFWVDLRLDGPGGRRAVLLLRDQLDGESWRALQAELRRSGARRAQ